MFAQPSFDLFKKSLKESIAPLVIVIGSGLSKAAGLPDWRGLRKNVQNQLDSLYVSKTSLDTSYSDPRHKKASITEDYWDFFQLARDILGQATYNGIIRGALETLEGEIPAGYTKIFELNPRGVVTLNLDNITGEAFAAHKLKSVIPIYGNQISKKWSVIRDEKSFLIYMHGHLHDHETWVLTKNELNNLLKEEGHSHFLKTMYLDYTVLFVGMSADDIAISSPLMKLKDSGFSAPRVFWLTNRLDSESDVWSRENDVQKILYKAINDAEHEQAISSFVDLVSKNVEEDLVKIPPAAALKKYFGDEIVERNPRKLANHESEVVRMSLSNILSERLNGLTGDAVYDAFDAFCRDYKYPIQTKSFYKDGSPPDNVFFGYRIVFPELGSGNFGEAYSATNADHENVCIKIMHSNIVNNREMIGGFRRGIRSMNILTKHAVSGVVPIRESFEMPPAIVMDLISGNSLQELFGNFGSIPWYVKIKIVGDIGEIISNCHKLPEMVLHRDVKPSNVMIDGLDYVDYDYIRLFVLDFDMSWHKNSSEKDIIFESRDDFGYLAPEQTDPSRLISTRSTKVDTYGLGMTAFALFGGKHPIAGWSMAADWEDRVKATTRQGYKLDWKCLPYRAARAIVDATKVDQSDRLDFISLFRRFEKLYGPASGQKLPAAIDLVTEELLALISDGQAYEWDDVQDRGRVAFSNGTSISLEVESNQHSLELGVRFSDSGSSVFKTRNQLLGEAKNAFEDSVRRLGYKLKRAVIAAGGIELCVSISAESSLEFSQNISLEFTPTVEKLRRI